MLETTSSCGSFDEASETVVDAEPNVLVNVFELDKGIFGFGSVLVLKPENPLNPWNTPPPYVKEKVTFARLKTNQILMYM